MAVEEEGLNAGEGVVVTIKVSPTGLHQSDLVVGEVVDGFLKKVGIGDEVCVENQNVVTFGELHAVFECSGLEASAVASVNTLGVEALVAEARGSGHRNIHGLIGGVIEDLNLNFVLRVIESGDGIEKTVNHV